MKLLFEKVTCETSSSKVASLSQTEDESEYSIIETQILCHNHGLMDSPKTNVTISKNMKLGVSLIRAFADD